MNVLGGGGRLVCVKSWGKLVYVKGLDGLCWILLSLASRVQQLSGLEQAGLDIPVRPE